MLKNLILNLYFCLSCFLGCSQSAVWRSVAFLPDELNESSGLVFMPSQQLIHINDGGNKPALIVTDTIGNLLQNYCVPGASNVDWEDLTKDEKGNIYIGDFGNNRNARKDLLIYKLPAAKALNGEDNLILEEIHFKYENQTDFPPKKKHRNFDTEAMVHIGDSIYLFTKNRTRPFSGYTYCYRIPDYPGNYVAEKVDSFYTGNGPMEVDWIAGAAYRSEPKTLLLLGYNKLWMFYYFEGTKFFSAKHNILYFDTFTQKEAIAFKEGDKVYLTDEKNNKNDGLLYELTLPNILHDVDALISSNDSIVVKDKKFKNKLKLEIYSKVGGHLSWEVFNTKGQRLHFEESEKIEKGRNEIKIDTQDWKAGKYTLHTITNNEIKVFKIKKKKD